MTSPSDIQPFRVDIPQAQVDDLRDRLARTRWPDELPDVERNYGVTLSSVKERVEYWRTRSARDHKNTVRWTEFDRGVHYAAHQVPDLLVSDLREFFRRLR